MLPKFTITLFLLVVSTLALASTNAVEKQASDKNKNATEEKLMPKRSLNGFYGDIGYDSPWPASTGARFSIGGGGNAGFSAWNPWQARSSAPSPHDVANAIAAAKQASQNVLIAQQQMQAAKENVLNQQRMAMEKETAATILTQKSEAAAAIQRSEAAAAAQAVVAAQQRLAASKSVVAHQQRIAAAREAEAAAALQRSAHAAAAEIQKTEFESAKFGQFSRNNNAGNTHHLILTKDTAFGPINSGINHVPNLDAFGSWASSGILTGNGGAKVSPPSPWL